jgi:hypothetical protein
MFMDEDVFDLVNHGCMALKLVRASHLKNLARFTTSTKWQVFNLTTPGWCISEQTIQQKTAEIAKLGKEMDLAKAVVSSSTTIVSSLWEVL